MDHLHLANLAMIATEGLFLYGLCITVYGARQMSVVRGSYLVRSDDSIMGFRKPAAVRRSQLAVVSFPTVLLAALLAYAPDVREPMPLYLQGVVCLSLPVFLLYVSGPDDIRLDGSRRTYERTVGFPWKPVTHSGTFDGIKGVSISPRNTVLLLLKKPGFIKMGIILSGSGTRAAAEALIEDLKREFGFPVVPYPKR